MKYFTQDMFLLLLFMFPFFLEVKAQNIERTEQSVDKIEWIRDKEEFEQFKKELIEENKRQELLKESFAPQKITEDGDTAYLDRINHLGEPEYLILFYNDRASTLIGADIARYNNGGLPLTGDGVTVGVWDASPARTTHVEFGGRVINKENNTTKFHNHSSHVTGIIAATGVKPLMKGLAPKSVVHSYDYRNSTTEMLDAASKGVTISNHSYGNRISTSKKYLFGKYGYSAQNFDQISYNAPYLLIVNAIHRDGGKGINPQKGGYDLLGDLDMSKNALSVNYMLPGSYKYNKPQLYLYHDVSFGPTDDYRIKPDITAVGAMRSTFAGHDNHYGDSGGTSMAAPQVVGVAALLQEYGRKFHNKVYRSATMKALLLLSAEDFGRPGPDFVYGWGLVDAKEAHKVISSNDNRSIIKEETLKDGEVHEYSFYHQGGPLKIMLSWTDVPAGVNLSQYTVEDYFQKTLVNDLDMRMSGPTLHVYEPFMMDPNLPYTQIASLGDNDKDNVEAIFIDNLGEATHTVRITHKGNLADDQDYSLIIWSPENRIYYFPNEKDRTRLAGSHDNDENQLIIDIGATKSPVTLQKKVGANKYVDLKDFTKSGTFIDRNITGDQSIYRLIQKDSGEQNADDYTIAHSFTIERYNVLSFENRVEIYNSDEYPIYFDVVSLNGKVVQNGQVPKGDMRTVSLEDLPHGAYIIHLSSQGKMLENIKFMNFK